jgi:putative aldouronate transport system permease protein
LKYLYTQRKSGNRRLLLARQVIRHWQAYLLLLPAVIIIFMFHYIPIYGAQLAFKEIRLGQTIQQAKWVGMKNFMRYFNSGWFWRTIKNTFVIGISMQLMFPLPILLALLLHNSTSKIAKRTAQTATYIPNLVSIAVTMSILSLFCDGSSGLINIMRSQLGYPRIGFYGNGSYVMPMYLVTGIWSSTGASAIVYLAALSAVELEQIEAAQIDGCSKLQRIWYIDVPTILPTIITLFILNMGRWFTTSSEKMLMLQTPLNLSASETTSTYTYKMGIVNNQYGISTAIGLFVNMINFTMLITVNAISRRVSDSSVF